MAWAPWNENDLISFDGDTLNAQMEFALGRSEMRMLGKAAKAAKACADATYDLSQVYCPIDRGFLRASAEIVKTGPYHYKITYGDAVAWYAVRVHEIQKFHHSPPTRWKYLQQAIVDLSNGHSDSFGQIMPYEEIFRRVFSGEEVPGLGFEVSDEPIPD